MSDFSPKPHPHLKYVRMFCDRFIPTRGREYPTAWERFCLYWATPNIKRISATDWRVFKVAAGKLWISDTVQRPAGFWTTVPKDDTK